MAEKRINIRITAQDAAQGVLSQVRGRIAELGAGVATGTIAVTALSSAFRFAVGQMKEMTAAAAESEAVIAAFRQSLRNSGQEMEAATLRATAWATAIANTTAYTDEAALGAGTLLATLGQLRGSGLELATRAAADLAVGLGVDLQDAAKMVAKVVGGSTESLGKFGKIVEATDDQATRLQKTLGFIEERFGGQAAAQIDTFTGRWGMLSKQFGEVQEAIGNFIVKNEYLNTLLVEWGSAMQSATEIITRLDEMGIVPLTQASHDATLVLEAWLAVLGVAVRTIDSHNTAVEATTAAYEAFVPGAQEALRQMAALEKADKAAAAAAKKHAEEVRKLRDELNAQLANEALLGLINRSGQKDPGMGASAQDQGLAPREYVPRPEDVELLDKTAQYLSQIAIAASAKPLQLAVFDKATERTIFLQNHLRTLNFDLGKIGLSAQGIADVMSAQLAQAFIGVAFEGKNAMDALRDAIRSIMVALMQAIVQALILKAIMAAFSGGTGFNVGGSVQPIRAATGLVVGRRDSALDAVPAILAPGEIVTTREQASRLLSAQGGRAGSGNWNFNVNIESRRDAQTVVRELRDYLRRQGGFYRRPMAG